MKFNLNDCSVEQFKWVWDRGGFPEEGDKRLNLNDALATQNAPLLFPKVISNIVREAAEPLLVGTSLLTRVNLQYGQQITFPAMGAMSAADIAEGEEYPQRSPSMGGATVVAATGKVGMMVAVTEEMVMNSQFDIIGMLLRQAGFAMARWKEEKVFNYIRSHGVPLFDNTTPTDSLLGVTTGRDMQGQPNGSLTMDDLFDSMAHIMLQGYTPDTILIHPLTWAMFVKDAQMREFVRAAGGGVFFATWRGNPAARAPWDAASQGGLGVASGQSIFPGQTSTGGTAPHTNTQSLLSAFPTNLNAAPVLPSYFNAPFRIIVSPFVPYDPRRRLADIYIFDSSRLGVLAVQHDIMTEDWTNPMTDIRNIKLKERYAIGILDEGKAIGVLRDVHVVPNEIALPVQAQIDVSGKINPIHPNEDLNL